ncbi:alkylation response protein AidB-like acyl-CoA dehydrogenase [Catenuloplanes nepalensis]|uniref:Alkylation response protein AidB-like acyl-CoA dehydrogenase n=1 Tax=Catenuloplanes nepalensis TaxID=587533 RepID=A0ABT9MNW8_9ACTN|nr:acyl-CoA dehydrogenase family protein [Catenuloplanes nepalensis]MDP9793097.1 alkylation response protein AidB-like acyl-CoA dehydrogenase [Catenuloplanes nepalensis]
MLLDAARKTVPTLAENAARTEHDLTPAPDSVAAVRAAGLFGLAVPRAAGGSEADLRTLVEVLVELGRGCPSTAWVVGLNAANKSVARLLLPDAAQAAILADPDAVFCASSGFSPGNRGERVPGGLRVSGRWGMASGAELASLAMVGVPLPDGPVPAMTLLPLADLSVERTWRAAGLGGTSSHTLVAEDVFVPDEFVSFPDPAVPPQGLPPTPLFTGGLAALAPMIGATLGARDLVADAISGGRAPYMTTYARVADSPLGRHWFTEALQRSESALRRTVRVADILDDLPPGGELPVTERMALRVELSAAARECREAMELLLDLHGASGFAEGNPLQRFWRDVAVGTRHPFFTPYILAEDHGRITFDVLPAVSLAL